ncbi:MAG: Unknown protein [uncultured Aureispira sp.]|uniref:Uncharacterized protein n=1 Tax=uncultured Aureispira sp. TaxID=1331704 RepID=A0A6S6UBQ5_9BACT|nr:MAG: Unknown protein [uncultured Aureispira sp.]
MSFFKNILDKLKGNKTNDSFPITIERIPKKLSIIVDEHQIPVTMGNNNVRALSYLSTGLSQVGQQELFFVLKTNQIDVNNIPTEPLHFFEQVYQFATQGQIVKEGDITQFGQKDLWGWKGIVYAKSPLHLQKQLPKDCLSLILLSLEEVQAIPSFGALRVLSMLGKQARYYPFPYWTDNHRANLLIGALKESLLTRVNRINLPEAVVTSVKNKHIYLKIARQLSLDLSKQTFPSSVPIGILPSLAAEADACLTWSFEPNKPEAISLPDSKGSIISGCLLVLIGGQAQNSSRILEDGFALLLTTEEWERFWLAFKSKQVYQLKTSSEGMDFSLIWE